MSTDVVDRLAEKWLVGVGASQQAARNQARWWLNAIADELEHEESSVDPERSGPTRVSTAIKWLREQAKED